MPFQTLQGRSFTGFLKTGNSGFLYRAIKNYTDKISVRYDEVAVGDMLARFNQLDLLEISINGADVSELLSLSVGSVVRVEMLTKLHRQTDCFNNYY